MIHQEKSKVRISNYLGVGRLNATTAGFIAAFLGWTAREVTQQIEKERREGAPICASCSAPHGYYLAENKEELNGYCEQIKGRAIEIFKTRKAMLSRIDELES